LRSTPLANSGGHSPPYFLRLQGYKTSEAADRLGEDPDVTRVRLSRLRRKLRRSGVFADW